MVQPPVLPAELLGLCRGGAELPEPDDPVSEQLRGDETLDLPQRFHSGNGNGNPKPWGSGTPCTRGYRLVTVS